ncbi:VanZ family protein [Sphingobacterium psychroaquaticum]|uniref:Uncharacterized protein n=1 Tax=Sphingobacterium psychroaquaticum TaxID=561061 RepID=A0A1X7KGF8_9SPHI|nr:VanZ family protein [Sphingobacterium psychroaquaticum]QBQ42834.1 glycine cleavage system protein H [Sphingobacterium psychroaquaticum]SMG40043.1 hypothetical protein SAMN05660862_2846 [Sphingobacterium psychroaquaticum]
MLRFIYSYAWAIIWSIIMLALMSMPSNDLPNTNYFEGFDKLAHCGFFFVFTTLLLKATSANSKRRANKIVSALVVFFVAAFFAFLTEGIQFYYSVDRMADWWDIFADFVGIGMALFSYLLLYRTRVSYK